MLEQTRERLTLRSVEPDERPRAEQAERTLHKLETLEDPAFAGRALEILQYTERLRPDDAATAGKRLEQTLSVGDPALGQQLLELVARGGHGAPAGALDLLAEPPSAARDARLRALLEADQGRPSYRGAEPVPGEVVLGTDNGYRDAQPETIIGHGQITPEMVTADRPVRGGDRLPRRAPGRRAAAALSSAPSRGQDTAPPRSRTPAAGRWRGWCAGGGERPAPGA